MYFNEYRQICEEGGMNPDNLLSAIFLEKAKERAVQMYLARKRLDILGDNISDPAHERMERWIKQQDELRVKYMFEALDYAEGMRGLSKEWDDYLRRHWTKDGTPLPKY